MGRLQLSRLLLVLGAFVLALASPCAATTDDQLQELQELVARWAGSGPNTTPIKHVVVLMEENRSFDHLFGFSSLNVEKLLGHESNPVNFSDPKSPRVTVDNKSPYVGLCDPCHGVPCTTEKLFGVSDPQAGVKPSMQGFINYEREHGHASKDYCGVLSMFEEEKLPIISTLAREYAIMDHFFASVPGPTWPNRLFCLSGTSAGDTATGTFFNNSKYLPRFYPQDTIFNSFKSANLSSHLYYHDVPWEIILEQVAAPSNWKNLHRMERFFEDAASGSLPSFSWINPRLFINITTREGSNDQHPDHDVALGEALIKQVYEALRAGPAWNETLFIVTYDEHGGFFDHVSPPSGCPAPDDAPSYPDTFDFKRLGVRIPTLLISPWIKKGLVISEPESRHKPTPHSSYDLTSIPASLKKMFGLPKHLSRRDQWSATFEGYLTDLAAPRSDCPEKLPAAPSSLSEDRAAWEAAQPLNDLQRDYAGFLSAVVARESADEGLLQLAREWPATQGEGGPWAQRLVQELASIRTAKEAMM